MQRGAAKRDREPSAKGSDYAGKLPSLRPEDRGHLGLTDEAFDKLAGSLKEKVLGYARAGFRKPADVSRLLNKEKFRTLGGTEWNPRLVHFLLGRIYGDRPGKPKQKPVAAASLPDQNTFDAARRAVMTRKAPAGSQPRKEKPAKQIKVRPPSDPVPLSDDEMARRLEVLKAHFNREGIRRS
jgi:hypothetical protein